MAPLLRNLRNSPFCLKLIENGYAHGLPSGKTDFRSKGQKKRDNQAERYKIEQEKLGKCSCGCQRVKRFNKSKKEYFLGCSNYPKCKITSSLLNVL